ncbi:MAG: PEP/pyruvate-binding domain-containing protein, partial [Desulfotignum sp.]
MKPVLESGEFPAAGKDQVGGKAWCLAKISGRGISIPKTWCVPCTVYQDFISQTRLRDRIFLEINRKP